MSLFKKTISGSIWTVFSTIIKMLIQILRITILVKLLDTADFGLLAILTLIVNFTSIFSDLGISTALFSNNNLTQIQKSSLYWINFILTIAMYGILCVMSPFIANFYDNIQLTELLPIIGLDLIIAGASKQYRVYKQKDMQFKQLSIIEVISSVVSLAIAYILATNGYGVYSLVYSTISASLINTSLILITSLSKYPLEFVINFKSVKGIFKIGLFQSGSQILDFLAAQLDIILMTKLLSVSELGVYSIIKQLILKLYQMFNSILSSVGLSALTNLKENAEKLKLYYLKGLDVVSSLSSIIFTLVALSGYSIILLFLGSDFVQYTNLFMLLCIWAVLTAMGNFASNIVIVSGMTHYNLLWTVLRIIFTTIFLYLGSQYGMVGIVTSQIAFSVLFYFVYWLFIVKRIMSNIVFREYFNSSLIVALKFIILGISIYFIFYKVEFNELIKSFVYIILYIILILIFFKKEIEPFKEIIYRLKNKK